MRATEQRKPKRKLSVHVKGAAQQAIAPDRIELACDREVAARCGCFPAGESRRWALRIHEAVELNLMQRSKAESHIEGLRREGCPTTHSTRLAMSLPFIRQIKGFSHWLLAG
jgi:hypothetical protein